MSCTKALQIKAALLVLLGTPAIARAFVSTAVGGHRGELDLNLRLGIEAGKIEPNENAASWRKATGFNLYTVGVGYTFGDIGAFQDVSLRLEGTYFTSPAERSDLTIEGAAVPPERCRPPARLLDGGACQFHPRDRGSIVTLAVATNFVHTATASFGIFLQGSAPFGMNLDKFANPPLHYIAGGTATAYSLTSWLTYESVVFVGTGTRPFSVGSKTAPSPSAIS